MQENNENQEFLLEQAEILKINSKQLSAITRQLSMCGIALSWALMTEMMPFMFNRELILYAIILFATCLSIDVLHYVYNILLTFYSVHKMKKTHIKQDTKNKGSNGFSIGGVFSWCFVLGKVLTLIVGYVLIAITLFRAM